MRNVWPARIIRCNLSQVPRHFEGPWRPHVAFAHTLPPDDAGRVTLGLNAGIDFAPLEQAMFKVAMVNARMPRWHIASHDDPATGQRINSALAASLSGEVCASMIAQKYCADVGGQFDFALGASCSRGGIAAIALPRVLQRDGVLHSKIVALHAEGAHHTISADLPVVVVTEQGVADLRHPDDPQRVDAIPAQLIALEDGR